MATQHGFTLIELMIVITMIAMLSAIGLPAYQGYLQKAALTDMLQSVMPLKTAAELCAIEHGNVAACSSGSEGIPSPTPSRYIARLTLNHGQLAVHGGDMLTGLTLTLTPEQQKNGLLRWQQRCDSDSDALRAACQSVFRFQSSGETP
ncbi:prepilin peptidase-dependent pilin [Pantoea sp. 1.19]|uniref:prepilin peptidase-dependent pilin n=1 Tax=Pantoea sp. 1.19 TaxID=1925589 RepID=UPI0009488C41|nr:prepilin peptidase-dependent pilin [Pantoea sp. 1.19]